MHLSLLVCFWWRATLHSIINLLAKALRCHGIVCSVCVHVRICIFAVLKIFQDTQPRVRTV